MLKFPIRLKKTKKLAIDIEISEDLEDSRWWMDRDYRYKKREGVVCQNLVKDQKID